MEKTNWIGKRVLVLGLARQGVALARYLAVHGALVTVSDMKREDDLRMEREQLAGLSISYSLGGHPLDLLAAADLLCLSGGVPIDLPIVEEARRRGVPLSGDAQLFLEASPAPVLGITGSAGKTTTTMLVGRMAEQAVRAGAFRKSWVGGNIGRPLLEDVDQMQKGDIAVMELSSFQLDLVTTSPHIAAVLNITPNHLDRHHTMDAYRAAKARIVDFQKPEDAAIFNWEDSESRDLAQRAHGSRFFFGIGARGWSGEGAFLSDGWIMVARGGQEERVLPADRVLLRGSHNLANAVAACAVAAAAGITTTAMTGGIEGFRGASHRLEFVGRAAGADWYNDSIATTPERAMAAIRSFQEPIVLLAGGRDKKLPWADWALLVHERVAHVVLFGEAAGLIESALQAAPHGRRASALSRCATLQEAVTEAARVAPQGAVVLLSPGGTSFDAFRDFEERGNQFRNWVAKLAAGESA
jgi:UDP-N-acetylmuramoylalanine--D-glutamate ligase